MTTTTTLQLPTGTWVLDTTTTIATITVKKMGAFTVPATLAVTAGTIEIVDGRVMNVDITADASSYASKSAKRNEHVVGADFLDAARHPTIRLQADDVVANATGATATGSVTVKGRTTPIVIKISNIDIADDTATFDATASVDRFDLGVDKMPSLIIGRQLELTVSASASRTV